MSQEMRIEMSPPIEKKEGVQGDESQNLSTQTIEKAPKRTQDVASAPSESVAFQAGRRAKEQGIPLRQSALRALRPGCRQYDDFIGGYESAKRKRR